MAVGFDFGTTNSLVSVVSGNRVIDLLGEGNLPHPSVVRYEGENVIIGHDARNSLDGAGLGVHGDIVRSPKFLLGEDVVNVGGVDRSPIDIVAEIVKFVKKQSLNNSRKIDLGGLESAVVTIPVGMDGAKRTALRQSFAQAGVGISQFVHEPFAALYAYIRNNADSENVIRDLANRVVLVVDWGGGTLDLTICKIEQGRVIQIASTGSDAVGGDVFDDAIRNEVERQVVLRDDVPEADMPTSSARLRLLKRAEDNKKELSSQEKASFFQPGYFAESGRDLVYELTRDELEKITGPLVREGLRAVDKLLEQSGIAAPQISKCILVGGMGATPAIREGLVEKFGHIRVIAPENGATLVSQGAAWIAHDQQRLVLAKPIELELARGNYLPLLKAGTEMPANGNIREPEKFSLFCADPTDGKAKFPIVTTRHPVEFPQSSSERETLGLLTLDVDPKAPSLVERITLYAAVDENLILDIRIETGKSKIPSRGRFINLEFGLALPGSVISMPPDNSEGTFPNPSAGLVTRANTTPADFQSEIALQASIPGDVLYSDRRGAFSPGFGIPATPQQRLEHLYYEPCSLCGAAWGDCDCAK